MMNDKDRTQKIELQVNGLSGPIVTDNPRPTMTALLDGSICAIAAECSVRRADGYTVWSSGLVPFTSPHFQYSGPALEPRTAYQAILKIVCDNGECVSSSADFETGLLGSPWQASWIEPEQEPGIRENEITVMQSIIPSPSHFGGHDRLRPCRDLKKTFNLDSHPRRARIYASAHGVYELQVNGSKAGINKLAPETSSYPQILYYQTYDATPLLQPGENVITATLADGWWIGRIGLSGDSCQYGDRLGFILQMEIDCADGSKQVICSDSSFVSRRSSTEYADLFIGERQNLADAPDSVWVNCQETGYETTNLIAQPIAAVCETARLEPVAMLTTAKGELVVDFGQVMAGVARLDVECTERCEIILDFCEVLDADGNFFRNIMGRNKDQRDVLICPAGTSALQPNFTYHGFRYVRISGAGAAQIKAITAIALGTPLPERGRFSCSDNRLNQLQHNIRQSTISNMFSVPTDCPQREKMGWTGDIQVFAKTGCFNYDLGNFLEGWLANMRAEQLANGEIPMVIPNYPMQDKMQRGGNGDGTSSAWGDACVLVPYYLYTCYGDRRVLLDNLPMMERWLGFVAEAAARRPAGFDQMSPEQQARNQYLWNKGHHFGDWLIPSLRKQPGGIPKGVAATYEVIASAFYAVTVRAFIGVLDALAAEGLADHSLSEKLQHYRDLLGKIRQAVREDYISPDGRIKGDLQGLYVLALYSGVAEGELGQKAAKRLAELIGENGDCLDTGFVSVPYLLDVLCDNGYQDLARKLLFQTKSPSWLYQVEKGATTIWENWEAILPDGTVTGSSFNHYALGCVGDWIYRRIGGIAPAQPGYRSVRIQPDIDCGLEYSDCSIKTAYGRVACSWRWNENLCAVDVEIPPNVTAEFTVREKSARLSGGRHSFKFER